MELKEPKSFRDLVTRLKEHGIEVSNDEYAEAFFKNVSYYRLSGYALQYRLAPNNSDCYPGTKFDDLLLIYNFDSELRNMLRKWIEIVEVFYRTTISHYFSMSHCTLPPHDQHYVLSNYADQANMKDLLDKIKKQKIYYKDSLILQHHAAKYGGRYPLWVIVEILSFSNLSKLYGVMLNSDQDIIAKAVGSSRRSLKNHLHCLANLRNMCAHAARLYNKKYNPPVILSKNLNRKHPEIKDNTLFAYIIVLLKRLPELNMQQEFLSDFEALLNKYSGQIDFSLIGCPKNYMEILKNQI